MRYWVEDILAFISVCLFAFVVLLIGVGFGV